MNEPSAGERSVPSWVDDVENIVPAWADEEDVVDAEGGGSLLLKPYDFRHPNRVSKDRWRTINAVFDRLSNSVGVSFNQLLRGEPLNVELIEVRQMPFADYTLALGKTCAAYVFTLNDEVGSQAIVDFGVPFSLYLVDRIAGGEGDMVSYRELTQMEQNLVAPAANRIMTSMADAWRTYVPLSPEVELFEVSPEVLEVAHREDPVLVANFNVSSGTEFEGQFTICLPLQALEDFLSSSTQRLARHAHESRAHQQDRRMVRAGLLPIQLDVVLRYRPFTMTLADLVKLRPGDRIHMGISHSERPQLRIQDHPYFLALPGQSGGMLTAKIETLHPTPDQLPHGHPTGRIMSKENDPQSEPSAEEQPSAPAPAPAPVPAQAGVAKSPQETPKDPYEPFGGLKLNVSVELGRTRMTLRDAMNLGRGSVITLDRMVGEAMEVYVEDRKIAECEVVVLSEEHFGARVTRVFAVDDLGEEFEGE